MTVEREEPDILVATCDGCGERAVLELDQGAEEAAIAAELGELGWQRGKPDRARFGFSSPYTVTYERDLCGDCQTGEPAPAPLFGSGRSARPATVGAFANDPCDEWPRALVFAAVGLRRDCGHPPSVGECSYCRSGFPIGRVDEAWRR